MKLRCCRRVICAAFVAAFALLPARADAHAIVMEAFPPIAGTLPAGDTDIRLRFNGRIDAGRSLLTLFAPDGGERRLPLTKTEGVKTESPDILAAHVTGLEPGSYHLHWQVLALDGHISRGDIPFRVTAP